MILALAEEMRRLERFAIEECRIPGLILMENAGRGSVDAMAAHFGDLTDKAVTIVAGPGNNGGDGLVIARHLLQRGARPTIYLLVNPDQLPDDAAANLAMVRNLDIPFFVTENLAKIPALREGLTECKLIVDAIFGIGLTRPLTGHYAEAVTSINAAGHTVVSVDIPSGLASDNGQYMGNCVKADLTTTFGLAKPGHFLGNGPEVTGTLEIIDISLPAKSVFAANLKTELVDENTVRPWLVPRPNSAHKGTFGHLLVLAGSSGKTGAALLCGRGALRSGVGLLTLAAPVTLCDILATALPEAMTTALPDSPDGHASFTDLSMILAHLTRKTALVLGPGLGRAAASGRLVAELYRQVELPMVVDADGLNLLVDQGCDLRIAAGPRILTPHPGEMARLTGSPTRQIQADRLGCARDFAAAHQVWLVLKGAATVIASPEGQVAINSSGNQLLAAGGSGDVLAGVIGSLLAQGSAPWQAATLGVYVHGRAADLVRSEKGWPLGLLASELADRLPETFSALSLY
jgi:NAD(P)H-hydrate epimerase